ncbi:MAG: DUF3419 family protein [Planctomycetota bacterium]
MTSTGATSTGGASTHPSGATADSGKNPGVGGGSTPWVRGRLDERSGPRKILFGRMYEDFAIERAAFPAGGRVFAIASAGCTALQLARDHRVVAVDINPVQLAYAESRRGGGPALRGSAERMMGMGRALAPMLGWWPGRLRRFLDLADPAEQTTYWRRYLNTWRFRAAFDGLLSLSALKAVYARELLAFMPRPLGPALRARLERCFARHPNRENPFARALFLGEMPPEPPPAPAGNLEFVQADAAGYLETAPAGSFDGFTFSNILDGADRVYEARLIAAVRRAAAPGAVVVLRSFREPPRAGGAEMAGAAAGVQGGAAGLPGENRAAADRAMLWGVAAVMQANEMRGFHGSGAGGSA